MWPLARTVSLALTAEGTLFSFGRRGYGQLGHGDTADQGGGRGGW